MARNNRADGDSQWNWNNFAFYGAIGAGVAAAVAAVYKAVTTADVTDIRERMRQLVVQRAQSITWRNCALEITTRVGAGASQKVAQVRALHAHASTQLRYLSDPALPRSQFVSPPEDTTEVGGGDCKWLSVHLATLFVAHGLPTAFIFHPKENPTHALLAVSVPFAEFANMPETKCGFVQHDASGKPVSAWLVVEPQAQTLGDVGEDTHRLLAAGDFTSLACS